MTDLFNIFEKGQKKKEEEENIGALFSDESKQPSQASSNQKDDQPQTNQNNLHKR